MAILALSLSVTGAIALPDRRFAIATFGAATILWILCQPPLQLGGILLQALDALDFLLADRRLHRLL
ncbi:MAG: hypothetical protein ACKVQU_06225, partial [Burkholderiales bacterium]